MSDDDEPADCLPTTAQIWGPLTESIRAEWPPGEHERRYVGPQSVPWTVPGADRESEVVDRETIREFIGAE